MGGMSNPPMVATTGTNPLLRKQLKTEKQQKPSNFENISRVTFLKHKNSKKQGTGTVTSR
jgi:hypothetical protein